MLFFFLGAFFRFVFLVLLLESATVSNETLSNQMSSDQNPFYLLYIGVYITQLFRDYCGVVKRGVQGEGVP